MLPKPKHLGPEYGAQFKSPSVIEAYSHRPPYPAEAINRLAALGRKWPGAVLDVGCGTGDIARRLTSLVDRVDAVDISLGMIEKGRCLPDGDHPSLTWIHGGVEEAPLNPPYSLITAGESLHWLPWEVVFPRFIDVLASEHGVIAMVGRDWDSDAIRERLRPIINRYSTNRDFQPYDLITELQARGLFDKRGEYLSQPVPWNPRIADYLECRHSQNGLSRDRMGSDATTFDRAVEKALRELIRGGSLELRDDRLQLEVRARVVWGKPLWPYT